MFNIHGGNKIENLCYLYFLQKHLCKFLFGDESILIDVKKSESNVRRILTPSFALDRIYLLELTLSTFSFSNYFIYQVHLLTGQLCQFLAVQDSSIGDIVTHSLTHSLSQSVSQTFDCESDFWFILLKLLKSKHWRRDQLGPV